MLLLVTGAGGFIGTHVRRAAAAAGLRVVTAGRSCPPGSPEHRRVDLAEDGAAAVAAMLGAVAPDAVVNCTGATGGESGALVGANLTGAATLAGAMLLAGLSGRLVHIGSAAEYGPSEPGVPVCEHSAARPAGLYGITKLAGTKLVELAATAGLDAVVLRVFNPVGPGAPPTTLAGGLAAQLRRALRDGTPVRTGPLDAMRDFVDARDVADAVVAAATAPAVPHAVLNVGSGRAVQARALADLLAAVSGYQGTVVEDAGRAGRSARIAWQQADIGLAARVLGWAPHRDLGTSLTDLWEASLDPSDGVHQRRAGNDRAAAGGARILPSG